MVRGLISSDVYHRKINRSRGKLTKLKIVRLCAIPRIGWRGKTLQINFPIVCDLVTTSEIKYTIITIIVYIYIYLFVILMYQKWFTTAMRLQKENDVTKHQYITESDDECSGCSSSIDFAFYRTFRIKRYIHKFWFLRWYPILHKANEPKYNTVIFNNNRDVRYSTNCYNKHVFLPQ